MTHNAESLVEYVLTGELNFTDIIDFNVNNFTAFLSHAPMSFSHVVNSDLSHTFSNKTYFINGTMNIKVLL